jgi:hypothetical protein
MSERGDFIFLNEGQWGDFWAAGRGGRREPDKKMKNRRVEEIKVAGAVQRLMSKSPLALRRVCVEEGSRAADRLFRNGYFPRIYPVSRKKAPWR